MHRGATRTDRRSSRTEVQRRLRAARAYAGYSLDELAAEVGVGRQTLVRIERGEREAKRMELREIAAVCGLPFEFFTADFGMLAARPLPEAGRDDAVALLAEVRDELDRLLGDAPEGKREGALPAPPAALVGERGRDARPARRASG